MVILNHSNWLASWLNAAKKLRHKVLQTPLSTHGPGFFILIFRQCIFNYYVWTKNGDHVDCVGWGLKGTIIHQQQSAALKERLRSLELWITDAPQLMEVSPPSDHHFNPWRSICSTITVYNTNITFKIDSRWNYITMQSFIYRKSTFEQKIEQNNRSAEPQTYKEKKK